MFIPIFRAEWLHLVLYFSPEYHYSRQNTIILVCSEQWLNLFCEYINGKLFGPWSIEKMGSKVISIVMLPCKLSVSRQQHLRCQQSSCGSRLKVLSNENRGASKPVLIDPILINCLVGKCPFPAPNGHRHERSRTVPLNDNCRACIQNK
jgi:hypothetical protein